MLRGNEKKELVVKKRITPEQVEAMKLEAHLGVKVLKVKYNIAANTVYRYLGPSHVRITKPELTAEQRRMIKNEPKTPLKILANKYGVAMSTISKIRVYNEVAK